METAAALARLGLRQGARCLEGDDDWLEDKRVGGESDWELGGMQEWP